MDSVEQCPRVPLVYCLSSDTYEERAKQAARVGYKSMKKQLEGGINELVADIENFSDSTLAHGFGGEADPVTNTAIHNMVHQKYMFNQHSIMVLDTGSHPDSTRGGYDELGVEAPEVKRPAPTACCSSDPLVSSLTLNTSIAV